MKLDEDVKKILNDHEIRLSRVESLITGNKRSVRTISHNQQETLTDRIVALRENGFFPQPRTAGEVHEKLQETYGCELNRVSMALLRLAKRRELRKAMKNINDKTYQAYVW
ncbi:hypothetical protein [Sulfuricaulis sp.]|uniref:hypothetical protein n=1 Tax=Sulfuricaulis sp. TaxID=2003553 RepID=UPI00355A4A28